MLSVRKLISIVMAVLFCALPALMTAYAGDGGEPVIIFENYEGNAKYLGGAPVSGTVRSVSSFSGSGSFLFYSQLSDQEKLIFNAVRAMTPGQTTLSVNVGTVSTSPDISTNLSTMAVGGVSAVFKDCPEFFWLTGSFSYGASGYPGTGCYTDVTLEFTFTTSTAYPSPATTQQQLENAVAAVNIPYGTRYDRLLALNNLLRGQVSYSETSMAHEATGALLSPYTAVCEGYAEAYKLLCDKYEIPNVLVIGNGVVSASESGPHMWNYVRLENGTWYAIDVTWNDQTSPYHNNYFLSGSGTYPSSAFYQVSFINSHVPSGYFTVQQTRLFAYPALSTSVFAFPTGFYLPSDAVTDDTLNQLTADGVFTVRYNGTTKALTATSYGTGTGSTFTAPTGTSGASETWKLIVRGDCTGNGTVTSADSLAAMRAVVGITGILTPGSAYKQAADLKKDGVIDAADAFLVSLQEN